jgi:hypothetical protein
MDYEDERQIREAVMGRFVDIYVYSFDVETARGKVSQYGISWAGIKELIKQANVRGKARFIVTDLPPTIEEHDTYYIGMVQTVDLKSGSKFWGVARQPKRKKGGQIDEAALTISVSKAQRNSFRHQLPEKMIIDFIRDYVEKKKNIKPIQPAGNLPATKKDTPQPVDQREFLEKSINNIAEKVGKEMKLATQAIINHELNANYGERELKDLGIDELKKFITTLSVKYNKLTKTTIKAAPVQDTMEES